MAFSAHKNSTVPLRIRGGGGGVRASREMVPWSDIMLGQSEASHELSPPPPPFSRWDECWGCWRHGALLLLLLLMMLLLGWRVQGMLASHQVNCVFEPRTACFIRFTSMYLAWSPAHQMYECMLRRWWRMEVEETEDGFVLFHNTPQRMSPPWL